MLMASTGKKKPRAKASKRGHQGQLSPMVAARASGSMRGGRKQSARAKVGVRMRQRAKVPMRASGMAVA